MKFPENNFLNSRYIFGFVFLLTFLCLPSSIFSQSKGKLKRIARKADNLYSFTEYNKALPLYLSLLEKKPDNVIYNFRVGVCYLNSNMESQKSIGYLETAIKNISSPKDSIAEIFYYSGNAYHIFNRFTEAIKEFKIAISLLDKNDSLDTQFIDQEIEQCKNGEKLMNNPTNTDVFNLEQSVNSIYPDYAPVIMPDQSMLIFTSKRKGTTGKRITPDGGFYEDIFISQNISEDWSACKKLDSCFVKPNFWTALFSPAKSIGKAINTNEHDASISLSPDGKKLFIYRFNAVWQSSFNNGIWEKPVKLNNYINGKRSHEPSVSLTIDENILYFVSEREGGFGGKDIYKSLKQADGTWGPAENLGPVINTEEDEEAPYIDPETNILYFSSQGHNSIGGFDVFKTKFENNEWKTPENLGYPVNSGADDIFYIFNDKLNKGYISSMRSDGIGNFDIFAIRNIKPANIILFTTYGKNLKPTDSLGKITELKTNNVTDLSLRQNNYLVYNSNTNFKLVLPEYPDNTNKITFEFKTPKAYGDFPFYQEINYDEVKNYTGKLIGYKTTVYNIFFNIEKEIQKNTKRDTLIKKEIAYADFVRTLKPDNKNFQVFTHINYIDTSLYAINTHITKDTSKYVINTHITKDTSKYVINTHTVTDTSAYAINTHSLTDTTTGTPKIIFKTLLFDFSKSDLTTESKNELEKIVTFLKSNNKISMEIVGHTDSKGSEEFNFRLAKNRAITVKNYLVLKGINSNRLKTTSMGESQPIALNENADHSDNPEGRKQNRRIEFKILKIK